MLHSHESRPRFRVLRSKWSLLAAPIISAFAALLPGQAFAVAPPAGTHLVSQATANYQDGLAARSVNSNPVETIVAQVYSHDLTNTQTVYAVSNSTVTLQHTLRNTGNGTDSYSFSSYLQSNAANLGTTRILETDCKGIVNTTPISAPVAVEANKEFCFIITGNVGTASVGASSVMRVGAAGNAADTGNYVAGTAAPTAPAIGNIDTVLITAGAAFSISQSIDPNTGPGTSSSPVTVTMRYKNIGASAAVMTFVDMLGVARQALPGLPGVFSDTGNMCYVAGSATDSSGGAISFAPGAASSNCTGTNESGTLTIVTASMPANNSGVITFKVNIKGAVVGAEHTTNTAQIAYGTPTVYGNSETVSYTIAVHGSITSVSITDTLFGGDTTPDDNAVLATAIQGTSQRFKLKVTNTGNGNDIVQLAVSNPGNFPAGSQFAWEKVSALGAATNVLLTSSTGVATSPDTGTLQAGSSIEVILRVDLPPGGVSAASSQLTVTATSFENATRTDTVLVTLNSITPRLVDVYSSASTADGQFSATSYAGNPTPVDPDRTVKINFSVLNPGAMPDADTFQLRVSGAYTHNVTGVDTTTALPTGWITDITAAGGSTGCAPSGIVTNTGNMAPAQVCNFVASIKVPAGYPPGTIALSVRALSTIYAVDNATSPEAGFDVLLSSAVVNTLALITIIDPGTLDLIAGDHGEASHKVCNVGNVANTSFTLLSSVNDHASDGWANVVYLSAAPGAWSPADPVFTPQTIGIGQCIYINDRVLAPSGLTPGSTNVTTLTFTALWSGGTTTTVTVVDSASISTGHLKATKTQTIVSIPVSNWPLSSTFQTASLGTQLPGAIIAYEVTLANQGGTAATGVVITDSIPPYTTLYSGLKCAPQYTVGTGTSSSISPTATTVTANVGILPASTTAKLTYCVQINQ